MNTLKLILLIIVVFIAAAFWRSHAIMNLSYSSTDTNTEQCTARTSLTGAEDITINQQSGTAYFATDERNHYLKYGENVDENGLLWSFDLTDPAAEPVAINANYPQTFHPHGISLLQENGLNYLFVVNHITTTDHQIDVFELSSPTEAKLLKTIQFPLLVSPNDVHALSLNHMLVTNDHGSPRHTIGEKLEDLFRLAKGNLVEYKEGTSEVIIDELYMANGITTSPDQKTVYLAESTGRRIGAYSKNEKGYWEVDTYIEIDAMPDNLEWDTKGNLLVASHPSAFDFSVHTFDPSIPSGSIAHEIDVATGETNVLYSDDGEQISGSSVLARYQDQLLIGSVFDDKFLHCRIPSA